jgi:hypothetical protein
MSAATDTFWVATRLTLPVVVCAAVTLIAPPVTLKSPDSRFA